MRILTAILILLVLPAAHAAVSLDSVLSHMDETAANFHGLQAKVQWTKYTAIVDVADTQEGTIWVRRNNDKSVDMMIEFQKPTQYFFSIHGTKAQIYRPRIAQVEEYDLSRSKDTLDQALLLGFGTAGHFLQENYTVTLKEEEPVAGQETVKLELVPKSAEMQKKITRLEMWVSKTTWHPVQEKLYEPNGGDYRLYTYSDIVLNPPLKDSQFRLKLPGNVKKVTPQK